MNICHKTLRVWALLAGLAFWPLSSALAVPADPTPREVVQPDGTKVQVRQRGDEHFHWNETVDGFAVAQDSDGFWKYAKPAPDKAAFQPIADARVGTADPVARGLKQHALPAAKLLRAHVLKSQQEVNPTTAVAPPTSSLLAPPAGGTTANISVSGVKTVKNIVILAAFSNHWDYVNNTVLPAYGRVDTNEYNNLYNQTGYNIDGATGSVKDYYREVSYGKLTLDSLVTKWVMLPKDSSYYGEGAHTGRPAEMVADAIEAAALAGFDFSAGDSDGDGWVDMLDVLHSGYGEEATGNSNDVWSVKGGLSSVITKNGVKLSQYHEEPALRDASGTGIERIGTICHETGHFFGLPDLYDYSNLTDGLGAWCIMASGSWNGNSGTSPAHFSAWAKLFLGFAKAVPIHSQKNINLPRVEDNAVVGMLRDGLANREYFLVENRALVGFDNTASIHPGLMIYHVDEKNANNDLGTWPHPAVKIEEADGNDSNGFLGGGSQAGDAWTSTNGLAGGFRDQTGNTNTSAMLYQAGSSFARTDNPAAYSWNTLKNFSAAGSNMTFDATTLKPNAPSGHVLPLAYTLNWAPASQSTKYEIQEGTPVTLTSFADGAESEEGMVANWHVAGKTMCVVTNASHGGSACYALLSGNYGSVEALTLRQPFKLTSSTVVSFYVLSHIAAGNGSIKCQISKDGGDTWKTLTSDNGNLSTWAGRTNNYTTISAQGFTLGDLCLLRFVVDIEYGSGWATFPAFGFALDDISITGTEIASYGNWTSLDNAVTGTTYPVAAKAPGVYAYRIQSFANNAWQGFGSEGAITVSAANNPPLFTAATVAGAVVGNAYAVSLTNNVSDPDLNDALTFTKISGPAWLNVAANGTLSGLPLPADAGTNSVTVRVTDLGGNYVDQTMAIYVDLPGGTLRSDLVAYLPFDTDFLDYSGRANNPSQVNANIRRAGFLGNGYVLTNNAYLSFGLAPDLHFANTTAGNTNSFTVSFWAKAPTGSYAGAPPYLANKNWAADVNTGWALAAGPGTSGSGYFQMNFKESNANSRDYDATSAALADGQWHHYLAVFKRDGTRTCYTYIDGVQADSRAMFASGVNIDGDNLPLNIGQDGTGTGTRGTWTNALMDDLGFWRRGLSAAEVALIYAAGTNGYGLGYVQSLPIITNQPPDVAVVPGGTLTLACGVFSATAPACQWRTNGVPIPGATSATYVKAGMTPADFTSYDVVVTNLYGATTSRLASVTMANQPPVANTLTVTRQARLSIKIPLTDLATNWSDPDGDALRLMSINLVTTNGVHLSALNLTTNSDGSYVITSRAMLGYANALNVNDQFSYTLMDAQGATTTGLVNVLIATGGVTGPAIGGIHLSGGTASMTFAGVPGSTYSIQRATGLTKPYTTLWTTNAPAAGVFTFTDTFADLGAPPASAYYRLSWTP